MTKAMLIRRMIAVAEIVLLLVGSAVWARLFGGAAGLEFYVIVTDFIELEIKPLEAPKVVIDLSHVEHLSSAALGMLTALKQVVVDKKGGGIAIANVNKDLHSIFKMTRLDKLVKMCDSTEKAVQSLV